MAASLQGTMDLMDRASPKLRQIERTAKAADRALAQLGRRLDRVSGALTRTEKATGKLNRELTKLDKRRTTIKIGTAQVKSAEKQVDQLRRKLAALEAQEKLTSRNSEALERELDATRRQMSNMGGEADTATKKLARFGAAFYGLSKIVQMVKLPAMAAGISLAVQWVAQLAGGVTALLPKLTDLVGIAGAAPAAFMGMAGAAAASKMAFSGLAEALGGNADAYKRLTPEAKKFFETVKSYKPLLGEIRRYAQQGLFPGLEGAMANLRRGSGSAKRMVRASGATVGRGVERFTESMTSDASLRRLEVLNRTGNIGLSRMFDAVTSLTHAFVSLGVAAGPFTYWLTGAIKRGAEYVRVLTQEAQASGRLRAFFERTRESMQLFGRILRNLWQTFRGIGKASRDLGDDLWNSSERATRAWAVWANSVEGQTWLRTYFDNIRETLHQTFGLVGDLFRAIMRLSNNRALGGLIEKLREMVPTIERIFGSTAAQLGGPLLDAVNGFLRIFSNTPYFASFVQLMARLLNLVGFLTEKIPGLSTLITAMVAVKMFAPAIAAVKGLAGAWGLVATNATAAAAATGAATGAGPVAVAGATRLGLMGRYNLARNPVGPVTQAGVGPAGASRTAAAGAALGGVGMMTGLRAAGKAALPVAALFAAADFLGTKGTAGERTQAMFSGATFGLIPRPELGVESREKGRTSAQNFLQRTAASRGRTTTGLAQRAQGRARELQQLLDAQVTLGSGRKMNVLQGDQRDRAAAELKELRKQLPELIRRGVADRNARSTDRGRQRAQDLQAAYKELVKGGMSPKAAFERTTSMARERIGRIPNMAGKEAAFESMMGWSREMASKIPALKGPVEKFNKDVERSYDRMGKRVKTVNGEVYTGTKKEWGKIASSMGTAAEQARQQVSKKFTAIQNAAVASLMASGVSRAEARSLVRRSDASGGAPQHPQTGPVAPSSTPSTPSLAPTLPGNPIGDGIGHVAPIGGPAPEDRRSRRNSRRSPTATAASPGLMGAKSGLSKYANAAARFGLHVVSGIRPGAITKSGNVSMHATGDALDLSGPPDAMMQFARYAAQHWGSQLEELIHTPLGTGQIKNGSSYVYSGAVAADHYDHVHIGDSAPGPGGGPVVGLPGDAGGIIQIGALPAGRIVGRGLPGAIGNEQLKNYARGLRRLVNRRLRGGSRQTTTGGGAPFSGGDTFEATAYGPPWNAMEGGGITSTGIKLPQNPTGRPGPYLVAVDPTVIPYHSKLRIWPNPFGYRGAFKAEDTGGAIKGNRIDFLDMMGRAHQNAWGRRSVRVERAGTGDGIGWGGWHGGGGDFSVAKPTLLGVGERGKEHVSIRPAGRREKAASSITVNIGEIHNHRKGDIKRMIEREMALLANDVAIVGADPD